MAVEQADGNDRPEALVDYATRRIKTSLATGEIAAGARLSPTALAKQFELSHIPVREALSSLAAMGYVVHQRGRGFFARELTSEDLADIYWLREVLETEAYRRGIPNLTDEDIAEMAQLVEQMSQKLDPESRDEYLAMNRRFHFIPFRRSGSRRLVRFLNYLWDSAQPYAHLGEVNSAEGHAEHVALVKILDSRDAEAVIQAMVHHRQIRLEQVDGWEKAHRNLE
ncbi:GntR family transcriptional regulator [Diaminobutyricimonas sp. TR449]|uniref:GntR family transcriptional regulator n=1 Tax=Diaminobutyricimonas sp. TR449 TaxID=2708076 RepID=UPI0014202D42|nr:GntR family transcriptional regulator [Diaminobutyricimonas sp. TR449]